MPKGKRRSERIKDIKFKRWDRRLRRFYKDKRNVSSKAERKRLTKEYKREHVYKRKKRNDAYRQAVDFIEEFFSQDKYKGKDGNGWKRGKTLKDWNLIGRQTKFKRGKYKMVLHDSRKWNSLTWVGTRRYPEDFVFFHGDRWNPDPLDPLKKELKALGMHAGSRLRF